MGFYRMPMRAQLRNAASLLFHYSTALDDVFAGLKDAAAAQLIFNPANDYDKLAERAAERCQQRQSRSFQAKPSQAKPLRLQREP